MSEKDTIIAVREAQKAGPPWSLSPPTRNGWYWFSPCKLDWDLARPTPVQMIDDGRVRYEAKINGKWVNVLEIVGGIWAGPFYRPGQPPMELLA